jgi:Cd(II)/Pb(II)-responsive transcriptional regulator
MKISELAHAAHTQSETIRYYEREGLLPEPARTGANYRNYDSSHLERLAFIRHCRSLDMTLSEVRTLLHFKDAPEENCAEVNGLIDAHVGHVAQRIKELKALEKELRALRLQCATGQPAADCGILEGLELAAKQAPPTTARGKSGHIHGTHGGVGK